MKLDKKLAQEIGRYLVVGGLATVFDYLAFALFRYVILNRTDFNLLVATAIGFSVGLTFNYIFSLIFVFKDVRDPKKAKSVSAFIVFAIIGLIGLGITELGMWLSTIIHLTIHGQIYSIPEMLAKVILTGIVLCWNYLARKFLIFKPNQEERGNNS